jgi:hypothetical protein
VSYQKNLVEILKSKNVDCSQMTTSDILVYDEYNSNTIKTVENIGPTTYCFCTDKFWTNGYTATENAIISFQKSILPCKGFGLLYIQYNAFTILVTLIIPILNTGLVFLLTKLTKFEKHKTLTNDLRSLIGKIFISSFINSGVIILVANAKIADFKIGLPIFTGEFDDFTPDWFMSVGISILFSMTVYAFTSQISFLLAKWIDVFKRCYDSGCDCNGKSTKKFSRKKYLDLYVGPTFDIGARYSEVSLFMIILR